MIKVLEKTLLKDNFINTYLVDNINIYDKINFSLDNIYYFGNYDVDKLSIIRKKINKNKNNILRAIKRGVKFIITGNSISLFNNNFNTKDINLFNSYDDKIFKYKRNKIKFKKEKSNYKIKCINNLNMADNSNFRYKNLICIKDEKTIDKIIKLTN